MRNFVISAQLCNYFAQLCNYFAQLCDFGAVHFCNSNLRHFVIGTSFSFYNFKSARLIYKTIFQNCLSSVSRSENNGSQLIKTLLKRRKMFWLKKCENEKHLMQLRNNIVTYVITYFVLLICCTTTSIISCRRCMCV